jgi:hypothetical protein
MSDFAFANLISGPSLVHGLALSVVAQKKHGQRNIPGDKKSIG